MLTHLDLFSGIGGFALAAQWAGFCTVGFCEIDPYCQKVLAKNFLADAAGCRPLESVNGSEREARMGEQESPGHRSPRIIGDIRSLNGRDFSGVSLITGGFPCQPFSCAGKRKGTADDRHLWPEMLRVISEAEPTWILGENVAGIINMELDSVLSDLEALGYACRPFVIPACGVDARHRRNRVWIVGHAARNSTGDQSGQLPMGREGILPTAGRPQEIDNDSRSGQDVAHAGREHNIGRSSERGGSQSAGPCDRTARSGQHAEHVADLSRVQQGREEQRSERQRAGQGGESVAVADAEEPGLEGRNESRGLQSSSGVGSGESRWPDESEWFAQSGMGRVANGIPRRVDRLRGLGNAIVPQVAFQILRAIAAIEGGRVTA